MIQLYYHIHALLNTKPSAVKAQVVVICLSPLSSCIKLIVGLSFFVLIMQSLHGRFLSFAVYSNNALCPFLV